MYLKRPVKGRFRDFTDYKAAFALWKQCSDHPNVHDLFGVELINGTPYVSLEYFPHYTLDELVKN